MKKQLIAAALATAFAAPVMAQQVTVYGLIDQGYYTDKKTAGTTATKTSGINSISTGSRIGFRAEEDLGGGLKATAVIEMGVTPDESSLDSTTTGLLNRQSFVGLSGTFGSVNIGRQYGHIFSAQSALDANANRVGAGWLPGLTNTSRLDDYVVYTSPRIAGFNVSVGQGLAGSDTAATNATKAGDITSVGVTFEKGPLSLRAVSETTTKTALSVTLPGRAAASALSDGNADRENISYGGAFDFKVAKVIAFATESKAGSAADKGELNTVNLGAVIPLGKVSLTASVSEGEYKDSGSAAVDLTGYVVGAQYALSRRTVAYAFYGEAEDKTRVNPAKHETAAIGIRHSF